MPLTGIWEFSPPDLTRFPCLALAYEAGRLGGTAPAVLNAADEVAVEAFRAGQIGFMDIPRAVEHALHTVPNTELSWASIPEADAAGRRAVRECFSLAATV